MPITMPREIGFHWWVPRSDRVAFLHMDTFFHEPYSEAKAHIAMGDIPVAPGRAQRKPAAIHGVPVEGTRSASRPAMEMGMGVRRQWRG